MAERNHKRAVRKFITEVKQFYDAGKATELTYRRFLEDLCNTLGADEVHAVNEAKRIRCGAPDITLMHKDIAIGYIEAKKVGERIRNFTNPANKNQFERYTSDLDNLIYTDCLKWDFYLNGVLIRSVSIAEIYEDELKLKPDNFDELADNLLDFLDQRPKTIKTAQELTEYMAKKTRIIRHAFEKSLTDDVPLEALTEQLKSFDEMLVKDISTEKFADMYAQTITYGLFVARLYSKKPEIFSRQQAQKLLPTTYPFLKDLFKFIASEALNESIDWAIDNLITLYRAADVEKIMETYGRNSGRTDPFLHFYEDFLTAYNPAERERSGVYYTPEPVVDFIIRGVDWVLENKFNLTGGLANSEKTEVKWKTDRIEGEEYQEELREVHKVQILDPATGTGTFLAQTIRHIEKQIKKPAPDRWSSYVDKDLLPRLHGFESMMAPYAMAYLKLDMVLAELGYKQTKAKPDRMSIYLTNSLTGANKNIPSLPFAKWLENEARGAADIKDNYPIMCVIGNPPYNAESINNDPWIIRLLKTYKREPDSGGPLKERKHWLNDDYVKFIRMAQYMVEKNGEGVVGMITSHGYLDNPTFRGMRHSLSLGFDEIYILDLHGNSRKKEVAPNRKPDENVFDIMAGVSIIIAWAKKSYEGREIFPAKVFHADLWGTREEKFKSLNAENLDSGLFKKITPCSPYYFFTPKNYDMLKEYEKGFNITDFMKNNVTGIVTAKDNLVIDNSKHELINKINRFIDENKTDDEIRQIFFPKKNGGKYPPGDSRGWKLGEARKKLIKSNWEKDIKPIAYRPFDTRYILYRSDMVDWGREKIMHHFLINNNLGLVVPKITNDGLAGLVTDKIIGHKVYSAYDINYLLPLYLYPNGDKDLDTNGHSKKVNMDETIRKAIEDVAADSKHGTPDEVQIFDYIYGVLNAPDYRKRYAEFLKTDFPYIPYPKDSVEFWHLSSIGTKLRDLHLMDTTKIKFDLKAYSFKGNGDDTVERIKFDGKKVWINETQYFDNVPKSAWDFYIGGYQPAQKWLKDRRGKTLETLDIAHYQRIIAVLVQTKTTMDEIEWSRP
ncbi:MAG: type ISP restriction/modification enzyme [Candidatus Halichondribacter symbioticus]